MSFLYPLLLAGVAAVALPIVLHLVRRHTRRRVPFSSLMFLRPTRPRFTSRRRLEHLPLLILRCLLLCLLALACARPFLRRPVRPDESRPGGRTVLLVDTSASMRRTGLWTRALDEARSVLEDAGPADRVCVLSFDRGVRTLVGFDQWAAIDPAQRAALAVREAARLSPGWGGTDLGHALVAAAEAIEEDEVNDSREALGRRRVVLISDVQWGGNLEGLLGYEWPERTELAVRAIPCRGTTNASLQLVTNRDHLASSRPDDLPEIRVTNSPDAQKDRFRLHWAGAADANTPGETLDIYVAPGHSVVLRPPPPPSGSAAATLVLSGDDHDFDNALYVAPRVQQPVNILYVGSDDPNDTRQMLYYLRQVFGADDTRAAQVVCRPGGEPFGAGEVETADLVIVADALGPQNVAPLRRYLESGGTLLLVMRSPEAVSLSGLAGMEGLDVQEAQVEGYAMLDRLEFNHPLLKPFSDPRFGDFTRIRFWKHRRLDVAAWPQARVLAWFDSDEAVHREAAIGGSAPAWLEVAVGKGSLLVWTSGWHPADSDLALSSKFVPLLYGTLEYGGTPAQRPSQYSVGDPVPVSGRRPAAGAVEVRRPDGARARLEAGQQTFTQTDWPGIYSISDSARATGGSLKRSLGMAPRNGDPTIPKTFGLEAATPQFFAVNLAAAESRTEPMPIEEFEKLGVTLQPVSDVSAAGLAPEGPRAAARAARSSFAEMESKQKLWRWLLVATFVLLSIEIWLAGWLGTRPLRPSPASEGELL